MKKPRREKAGLFHEVLRGIASSDCESSVAAGRSFNGNGSGFKRVSPSVEKDEFRVPALFVKEILKRVSDKNEADGADHARKGEG